MVNKGKEVEAILAKEGQQNVQARQHRKDLVKAVKGNAIVPMPPAGDGGGASDGGRRPRDGARAVRAPFAQAHKHENTQTLKHSTSGDPPGGF